jgi:hypothetical protein
MCKFDKNKIIGTGEIRDPCCILKLPGSESVKNKKRKKQIYEGEGPICLLDRHWTQVCNSQRRLTQTHRSVTEKEK